MTETEAAGSARPKTPSSDCESGAVQTLLRDGYVVLNDAIDQSHIAAIRDKMFSDIDAILALETKPYNFTKGHIQHDPPPFPPYLFDDVLLNRRAVAVTKAILGAGLKNAYYSGNTNLPGSPSQPPA